MLVTAIGVLLSGVAWAQDPVDVLRIASPGPDSILQGLARDLAEAFPLEATRPDLEGVDLEGTDMRACMPAPNAQCHHDLTPFGTASDPATGERYEMRSAWPAGATEPTIRYPRIAGFVAADFAIRRVIPIVLRDAGLDADAARLADLHPAHSDAELRALAAVAKQVFERLRALPAPATRVARRALGRARSATRLGWQLVRPLFRVHDFPLGQVLDPVVEVVRLAALADAEAASEATVTLLTRVAAVARSIQSWEPS